MKCSECDRELTAKCLPGRYSDDTYLYDFPMQSEFAKQIGDDWVGIIHDGVVYCRRCLPGWRVLGAVRKNSEK